jgi:hypothetical protein
MFRLITLVHSAAGFYNNSYMLNSQTIAFPVQISVSEVMWQAYSSCSGCEDLPIATVRRTVSELSKGLETNQGSVHQSCSHEDGVIACDDP